MFDLKDKVVLVTGGGGLLGRMHSEVVVENGGKVIVGDINIEAAQKVADDLNEATNDTLVNLLIEREKRIKTINMYLKILFPLKLQDL